MIKSLLHVEPCPILHLMCQKALADKGELSFANTPDRMTSLRPPSRVSAPDHRDTFLVMPMGSHNQSDESPAPSPDESALAPPQRVLVVEDLPDTRESLQALLKMGLKLEVD